MSEDGELAIVLIAMQGNPFSPDYFRARRRGPASPFAFCSMHVAVYGRDGRGSAWAFEERAIEPALREPSRLRIGRSAVGWEEGRLVFALDERTTPAPRYNPFRRPVRGRVVVHPEHFTGLELAIDAHGEHRWFPMAPLARIEVELSEPAVRFTGHGYLDANLGAVALDRAFETWSWSRARVGDEAYLTYDVRCADGARRTHAFGVSARRGTEPLERTWRAPLERSFWRIPRDARVDAGEPARIVRSLEDGPFYTRALISTRLAGRPVVAVHETLAAHRLRRRWVRFCTSYKMRSG
ncbi:MAG TPA: carotenoid 1,2-hydratase [Sandaracinaceae bacterium LLY-WYZ-13_1]|nr:carotenoid 1,2-hydratase [Sandaracinaceae bacterium LLY-WYZ-13_1]